MLKKKKNLPGKQQQQQNTGDIEVLKVAIGINYLEDRLNSIVSKQSTCLILSISLINICQVTEFND